MFESVTNNLRGVISEGKAANLAAFNLIEDHAQQVVEETKTNFGSLTFGIVTLVSGFIFAIMACFCISFAAYEALKSSEPTWSPAASMLIIFGVWTALAIPSFIFGVSSLKKFSLLPRRSLHSISESIQWALRN